MLGSKIDLITGEGLHYTLNKSFPSVPLEATSFLTFSTRQFTRVGGAKRVKKAYPDDEKHSWIMDKVLELIAKTPSLVGVLRQTFSHLSSAPFQFEENSFLQR